MTQLKLWISVTVILALVLLGASSCHKLLASTCVGSGTQTATLNLCLPAGGDNSWGADLRNNFTELSNLFTATTAQGAHNHSGTAGEGAKIPSTSLDCLDSPTQGEVLIYNQGAGQCEWGAAGAAAIDQSASYNWSGAHVWNRSLTSPAPDAQFNASGNKGSATGHVVVSGVDISQGTARGFFLTFVGGGLWSGIYSIFTAGFDPTTGLDFGLTFEDTFNTKFMDFGIVPAGLTADRTVLFPDRDGTVAVNKYVEITIDSNGTGSAANANLTPTQVGGTVPAHSYVDILCNDGDGCDVDLLTTAAVDGAEVTFILQDAGPWTFQNGGSFRLEGNTDFTTGNADDLLTVVFTGTKWREKGRSVN